MKYCFFGLNPGAMTKYPAGVARSLAGLDPTASFTFFVDDPSGLDGIEFPPGSEFRERAPPRASDIRDQIASVRPDAFVTTAQRIPDSAFVSAAREAGIFTCMFQHGLYLPFMRREPSHFLRNAAKTWAYVRYAAAISEIHGQPSVKYIRELSRIFVWGEPYAQADLDHRKLNVDLVLLNGDYWRAYHTRQFGYPSQNQVVVGYPDYDQLPDVESQPLTDAVCYIAQTLVEHGRLAPRVFHRFLEQFAESLGGTHLIVKLHPASDLSLYAPLQALPNVAFSRQRLPRVTHYVGHYSTYLALVPFLSQNLLLWEFDGHPIPESVRPAASVVASSPEQLTSFVSSHGGHAPDTESIEAWKRFFFRGDTSAYDAAAEQILAHLK